MGRKNIPAQERLLNAQAEELELRNQNVKKYMNEAPKTPSADTPAGQPLTPSKPLRYPVLMESKTVYSDGTEEVVRRTSSSW